jgi:hypothetical protein
MLSPFQAWWPWHQDIALPPGHDQGVRSGGQGEDLGREVVERAAILSGTRTGIEAGHLPPKVRQSAGRAASAARILDIAEPKAERQIIHRMSQSPL